ncbi:MAG: hypothetical protein KAK01_00365 [Candidatus Marinimicrobia bacterium]|nr:hypothetical protein [Candidatus Neomarinimicrobiota bacterium]
MGQQQLLLIVLGTIIVGVAVVVGINMFGEGAVNAERDALLQDVNSIASNAAAYWRKPAALGGGARTFVGITSVTTFGSSASNANGTFTMTVTDSVTFELTAFGANEGVTIVATVTQDGVQGTPDITL